MPDSSGPAPGAPGTVVVGVDVAYDDARDLVAAAAVALDAGDEVGRALRARDGVRPVWVAPGHRRTAPPWTTSAPPPCG